MIFVRTLLILFCFSVIDSIKKKIPFGHNVWKYRLVSWLVLVLLWDKWLKCVSDQHVSMKKMIKISQWKKKRLGFITYFMKRKFFKENIIKIISNPSKHKCSKLLRILKISFALIRMLLSEQTAASVFT